MPSEPAPLNEREQADLVAYLDHELAGTAARRVEARLSQDAGYRAEADCLKQVWDLLDHLPQAEPSPAFTERTLQRLTLPRPAAAVTGAIPRRRRKPWLVGVGWAAALFVATYAGFSGFDAFRPHGLGEADLVRDLRLIENKRLYDLIDDLDFLQELDHPELFGDEKVSSS